MNYISCNFICQCLHMDEASRRQRFHRNIKSPAEMIRFLYMYFIRKKSKSDTAPVQTESSYGMHHSGKST